MALTIFGSRRTASLAAQFNASSDSSTSDRFDGLPIATWRGRRFVQDELLWKKGSRAPKTWIKDHGVFVREIKRGNASAERLWVCSICDERRKLETVYSTNATSGAMSHLQNRHRIFPPDGPLTSSDCEDARPRKRPRISPIPKTQSTKVQELACGFIVNTDQPFGVFDDRYLRELLQQFDQDLFSQIPLLHLAQRRIGSIFCPSVLENLPHDMDKLSLWTTGWRLGLLTIFILVLSYLYFQKRRQDKADELFGRQHGCQPIRRKLPYTWPFAIDVFKSQYDALMRGALLAYQADFFRNFDVGQTFEVRLLGQVGYFTMDPKNLEHMLQTQFATWALGNSRDALLPMIGHGIFTQDGPAWKHSRELLRRQFVRMHYQDISSFERPVNDLLAHLQRCTGGVDLQPAFFSFTLATTVALIFGEPFPGLEQNEHAAFAEAFDYTSLISAMRMRLADWYWVYNPSKYRKACALINTYATHYVNHALKELEENGEDVATKRHPFILDLFRALQHPKLVHDQLMNVLIAGRDTTACLMSWACYQLVRHPASLERLRQEILRFTTTGDRLTRADINKMTYLRCVLNETNRLYTQIPVNIRISRETTFLPKGGGRDGESPLLIPKGTGVGFSAYHMHRSKETYGEDADEFRPERWQGTELRNIGFAFMPFHGGPRLCLGKDFALTEASYGLIRVLKEFPNLRIAPGASKVMPGKEKQNLSIVVSSAEGCKVLLR